MHGSVGLRYRYRAMFETGQKKIKCLVWDLDQTLWSGVLLEGDPPVLRPGVRTVVEELDRRGVLQSVASQGDSDLALAALHEVNLQQYFLAPQINLVGEKAQKIATIAEILNIQLEHIGLIDDCPYQRAAVSYALPDVTVLDAQQATHLPRLSLFGVGEPTAEARNRRQLYTADLKRRTAQQGWNGSRADFLRSCQIVVTLRAAAEQDVARITELCERTHRFNASALRASRKTVCDLIRSEQYCVIVAQLSDRFGDQGLVGGMILRQQQGQWELMALLVSCRVMGRGVGETLLCRGLEIAKGHGQPFFQATYQRTAYNRMMALLFVAHGFRRSRESGDTLVFVHDLKEIPNRPAWIAHCLL